jgi:ABC-type amino acid transport substrate-binding protein
MKKLLTILVLISLTAPAFADSTSAFDRVIQKQEIRCGYASWPPFLSKDPNTGKIVGFNVDIIEAIGKELGLKIVWTEEVGFGNYIEGLRTGRYDMMCQTVWPDAGRLKNALVTIPVHYHKVHVIVRADDKRFDNGWQKLNDPQFKAAVIDGDITNSIANLDFPKAKLDSLPQTADAAQLFTDVETGKADATFVDYGFFQDYNKKNPGKLKIAGEVLRVYGSVFSVNNGEVQLKDMIDNALILLINSGRIAEILHKYDPASMPPAPTFVPSSGKE